MRWCCRRQRARTWRVCLSTAGGQMSILVTTTAIGSDSAQAMAMCSLVMRWTPMFAPTTKSAKSGIIAVSPNTVVLRYRSWPHRSMSVTLRSPPLTTSAHRWAWCLAVGTTCAPSSVKPMSSTDTAEVRPFDCSCLCLKTSERAAPRPSSRPPEVRTPMRVDLPESTLPIMATRTSDASQASPSHASCAVSGGAGLAAADDVVALGLGGSATPEDGGGGSSVDDDGFGGLLVSWTPPLSGPPP
mmetsp:Transcript_22624/g.89810  ORF Transcript_22624/g.89810 Transcript_22624/m.89810 type:complete len:243 (+) Transcript_22624:1488-2216(+)